MNICLHLDVAGGRRQRRKWVCAGGGKIVDEGHGSVGRTLFLEIHQVNVVGIVKLRSVQLESLPQVSVLQSFFS